MGGWLADAGNGIANIFAQTITATTVNAQTVNTHVLCITGDDGSQTCVTKSQLDALLNGQSGGSISGSGNITFSGGKTLIDLAFNASQALLLNRDDVATRVTGPLAIKSDGKVPVAASTVMTHPPVGAAWTKRQRRNPGRARPRRGRPPRPLRRRHRLPPPTHPPRPGRA